MKSTANIIVPATTTRKTPTQRRTFAKLTVTYKNYERDFALRGRTIDTWRNGLNCKGENQKLTDIAKAMFEAFEKHWKEVGGEKAAMKREDSMMDDDVVKSTETRPSGGVYI
jgi:hypothetical protein